MSLIDPDLIQRYYAQLSDQELLDLTTKEGNKLTDEAVNFLYDEFVKRGLDTTVLGQMVEKKDQHKAAAELDTSYWNYAINARKIGKSDTEILRELTSKQVGERQAALIIKRIPDIHYENEQFDNLISNKCQNTSLGSIFAVLFLFGIGAYFMYTGIQAQFFLPILLGLGTIIGSIFIFKKYDGDFKGGDYWVELIKTHPEKIVWIKPIVTKHTVGIVITLFREQQFQLLTKDDSKIVMTIDTEEERHIFFDGVKHLLPHAHIGYTYEIDALYSTDPENFITTLRARRLYTPIDTFNLSGNKNQSSFNADPS